jgi:hypothetical protein
MFPFPPMLYLQFLQGSVLFWKICAAKKSPAQKKPRAMAGFFCLPFYRTA